MSYFDNIRSALNTLHNRAESVGAENWVPEEKEAEFGEITSVTDGAGFEGNVPVTLLTKIISPASKMMLEDLYLRVIDTGARDQVYFSLRFNGQPISGWEKIAGEVTELKNTLPHGREYGGGVLTVLGLSKAGTTGGGPALNGIQVQAGLLGRQLKKSTSGTNSTSTRPVVDRPINVDYGPVKNIPFDFSGDKISKLNREAPTKNILDDWLKSRRDKELRNPADIAQSYHKNIGKGRERKNAERGISFPILTRNKLSGRIQEIKGVRSPNTPSYEENIRQRKLNLDRLGREEKERTDSRYHSYTAPRDFWQNNAQRRGERIKPETKGSNLMRVLNNASRGSVREKGGNQIQFERTYQHRRFDNTRLKTLDVRSDRRLFVPGDIPAMADKVMNVEPSEPNTFRPAGNILNNLVNPPASLTNIVSALANWFKLGG